MMYYIKIVILIVTVFPLLEQNMAHTLDRKCDHSKCQIICNAVGGTAELDPKSKLCKCLLTEHIDDTDIALGNKNAKLIEKELETIKSHNGEIIVIKREVTNTDIHNETDLQKMGTEKFPQDTFHHDLTDIFAVPATLPKNEKESDLNPEGIVGQQAPNPLRRLHHQRLVAQRRHREPRPITSEQQKLIIVQIREHLNRLSHAIDQRSRQMEIDAMKINLKQLSESVIIQTPQQRSRLRNVVEDTRKKQQRQRLMQHSRVGAVAAHENSTSAKDLEHNIQENQVENGLHETLPKHIPHFEIITQDPSLIDE